MSLKKQRFPKLIHSPVKCCFADSLLDTPQSDKTCASIQGSLKDNSFYNPEYVRGGLVSEYLKNESLIMETSNLAKCVEGLKKSFEEKNKHCRRHSTDFYIDESFRSDETILVLQDQVDMAKRLKTSDFEEIMGLNLESFDNSFESFSEGNRGFGIEKDFKNAALLKSIVLLKFHLG